MKIKITIAIMATVVIMQACKFENEEELFDQKCDIIDVSYSQVVVATLDASCLFCHGDDANAISGAGIDLEGYDDLKIWADNGRLLSSINHDGNASEMPKGGSKIDQCKIDQIEAWINDGARNN